MAAGGSSAARVRWLSDQEKAVLLANFEKRGWVKGSSEGQINLQGFVWFVHLPIRKVLHPPPPHPASSIEENQYGVYFASFGPFLDFFGWAGLGTKFSVGHSYLLVHVHIYIMGTTPCMKMHIRLASFMGQSLHKRGRVWSTSPASSISGPQNISLNT